MIPYPKALGTYNPKRDKIGSALSESLSYRVNEEILSYNVLLCNMT